MRPDMSKVVIERPRHKGYGDVRAHVNSFRKPKNARADEALPSVLGVGKYKKTKELSDLTGPLTKFIESRVGKRWDKVYAEISEHINRDNEVQRHIFTHIHVDGSGLPGAAVLKVDANGKIFDPISSKPWSRYTSLGNAYWRFYVDPRDGILKRYIFKKRERRQRPVTRIDLDDTHFLEKVNGIWFWFEEKTEDRSWRRWNSEIMAMELVENFVTTTKKRQLSTKELVARKLENDPE